MKDQFFADYLQRLEDLQGRLHKEVQNLSAEAMDWSPGPQMNSVAVLLAHITGVLHEGIDLALGDPPGRVRAQEFQTRGVLSGEMLRRLDAVIDYARGALPRLGLEDLQRRLHKDVRDLPADAMDWSPGPDMNSVAVLLAHIVGVLHEGIDIALDEPPSRVRAREFQTRGVLSAEMLRHLDAVIDYARGALPRLGLADLAQARQDEDGPITGGWALLHALEHAYLHLGHAQLTCQMWRQREK